MSDAGARHAHLFFKAVRLEKKTPPISLELRPRVHAILAPSTEVGDELVRCGAGMTLPHRGRVLLGSEEPARTPRLRARIGTLLRDEPPLDHEGSVRSYLERVLGLRHRSMGREGNAPAPEEVPHVAELLGRPAAGLSATERRLVALGLALHLESPAMILLHDPLTDVGADLAHALIGEMSKKADDGAIVACIVPTERAARQLSDRVHDLQGRPVTSPPAHFLIRSERVRDVASLLSKSQHIISTELKPSGDLLLGARSESAAADEITQALCAAQVDVFEVRRVFPPFLEGADA